jgi:hypothetical protein
MINGLRKKPGFKAYLVLNSDGVVLKWGQEGEQMSYERAVHYSHHVLDLYNKCKLNVLELFDVRINIIQSLFKLITLLKI